VTESLAGAALQALGDANRRAIVEELRGGERSVVELTRRLQISQPAVRAYIEGVWGEAAARFRLAAANTPRPGTQR